jgi:hypothetical protein
MAVALINPIPSGCPHTAVGEAFNPFYGSQLDDPYPFYARARRQQPVFFSPLLKMWVRIPVRRRFGQFYMTILASRIAGDHGLGLLTDGVQNDEVANIPRRYSPSVLGLNTPELPERRTTNERQPLPGNLKQGLLVSLGLVVLFRMVSYLPHEERRIHRRGMAFMSALPFLAGPRAMWRADF